jgi:hypothetical protein
MKETVRISKQYPCTVWNICVQKQAFVAGESMMFGMNKYADLKKKNMEQQHNCPTLALM